MHKVMPNCNHHVSQLIEGPLQTKVEVLQTFITTTLMMSNLLLWRNKVTEGQNNKQHINSHLTNK